MRHPYNVILSYYNLIWLRFICGSKVK